MYQIKKLKAFTLNEMLMVMAIIGILLLLALPTFMPLISKAKSQEAKIQLKYIANLQTQYRYINSKYSQDFNEIDFLAPKSVKEGGTANYSYQIIEASTSHFKARAESIIDFDGDGILNVWEVDENGNPKEIVKD
jgi:type IV pilus assembly protein PilE